jgi:hypothetical protein
MALFTTVVLTNMAEFPAHSQPRDDAYTAIGNPKCISAIHQVHSDIENRIGGVVGDVTYYDPSAQMTDSPNEKSNSRVVSPISSRQMRINFGLLSTMSRGRQATVQQQDKNSSLISSPALTKKYTEQILYSCADIGSVRFWLWEYGISWSIDNSGQAVRDRCVDYETWQRRPLVWGEMLCV